MSPNLTYHGVHHAFDVLNVVNQYLKREKIIGQDAQMLRIGAICHDLGFLKVYKSHEETGVEMTTELMKLHNFSQEDIDVVSGLIMATKVPQKPKSHLEEIICDSDLDYLGRDDFDAISESLFVEMKNFNFLKTRNEWNEVQVRFLENHTYHTDYAKKYRSPNKAKRLEILRMALSVH